jgi:hypothetical protein
MDFVSLDDGDALEENECDLKAGIARKLLAETAKPHQATEHPSAMSDNRLNIFPSRMYVLFCFCSRVAAIPLLALLVSLLIAHSSPWIHTGP